MVRSMPARRAIIGQKIDKNVMNSRKKNPDHPRKQEPKIDAPRSNTVLTAGNHDPIDYSVASKPTSSVASSVFNSTSHAPQKKRRISLTASNVTKFHEDSGTDLDDSFLLTAGGAAKDDDASSASTGDRNSDESWLDGSTLIAQYADEYVLKISFSRFRYSLRCARETHF